jgi:redox-sensitive bicupin YhaK (pirin superfamily)
MTRRTFALGAPWALVSAAGCVPAGEVRPPAPLDVRPASGLPETSLPWLSLRDHFVATVGDHAGEGRPLGPLLVLADATFAPHSRFPLHAHRDMEILSLVLEGTLTHHGDQSDGAALPPRGVQLLSARDGIEHAEGNDTDHPTRMLQLWFRPQTLGGAPSYRQRQLDVGGRRSVAGDDAMPLRCDARVEWIDAGAGERAPLIVDRGRAGYLLALNRSLQLGGVATLAPGDGAVVGPGATEFTADTAVAALWIDVAL